MHKFLVCVYNSQDFAPTQENFARSHNRDTVTFRNSENILHQNTKNRLSISQSTTLKTILYYITTVQFILSYS